MYPEKGKALSKRELHKEARRNEIIEAGLLEFISQGFMSTRLDDVAERAGISKGTIYLYFDNKEKLFEEVVRKNLSPSPDKALDLLADFEGSAEELLTLHLEGVYALLNREHIPALVSMMVGEVSRFPKLTEFFFKEMVSRHQGLLSGIIKKGIDSGEFIETGLEAYPQILTSPSIMLAIWEIQFNEHSPIDIAAYARTHIDFVLRGLKA